MSEEREAYIAAREKLLRLLAGSDKLRELLALLDRHVFLEAGDAGEPSQPTDAVFSGTVNPESLAEAWLQGYIAGSSLKTRPARQDLIELFTGAGKPLAGEHVLTE